MYVYAAKYLILARKENSSEEFILIMPRVEMRFKIKKDVGQTFFDI